MPNLTFSNADCLQLEFSWFEKFLNDKLKIYFEQVQGESELENLVLPDFSESDANYARLVKKHRMGLGERVILILALIPHLKPQLLDILQLKNVQLDAQFTEFGGVKSGNHRGFLPTGETALFLLAGSNLEERIRLMKLFDASHFFAKEGILSFQNTGKDEPYLAGALKISREYLSLFTTGEALKSDFDFPAKRITTDLEWSDLIVSENVRQGIEEMESWLLYGKKLKKDFIFGRRIKPGFRALFSGPPGTGKTLAATLLGKAYKLDVYRIDLSKMISKYIGETEKNLSKLFDQAENKNWILFFDEADALFGKRSQVSDSHDRYANQEVAYLLQRIEDFDGLVIFSSNFKNNIDKAFLRRFQLVIDFEIPDYAQRLKLWETALMGEFKYDQKVNLKELSEKHELSAAAIINVLHFCLLKSLQRGEKIISMEDLIQAIRFNTFLH
jgi:hypothetical protein